MKCPNCGRELADNAKFCGGCGTKITPDALPAEPNTLSAESSVTPPAVPAILPNAAPNVAAAAPVISHAAAASGPARPAFSFGQDGSLRSLWESFAAPVRALNLTGFRKTATIAAAATALCFLISLNGSLLSWSCTISGLLLLWLCAKGFDPESVAMASSYSLLVLATLVTGVMNLIRYGGSYFLYGIETVIIHLVFYAIVVVVWLCVSKRNAEHSGLRLAALILSASLASYELVYCFSVIAKDLRMFFYGLGWMGFISVYGLLLLKKQPSKTVPAPAAPSAAPAPDGIRCPHCGALLPKDSLFCDKCGLSVTTEGK